MVTQTGRALGLSLCLVTLVALPVGLDSIGPGPLDLTAADFEDALLQLPDSGHVVLEFYASWCPACRAFMPEYEKVALHYADQDLTVARVDCATQATICGKFNVGHYPTLRLGRPSNVAKARLDALADVDLGSRTARAVITAVDRLLAKAVAEAGGDTKQLQALPDKVDLIDVEAATIKSWQYLLPAGLYLNGPEARSALQQWLRLLQEGHPLPHCRESIASILSSLDITWPEAEQQPKEAFRSLEICGSATVQEWSSCKGSKPGTRGYTCALWQLFHSLASRLPEQPASGAVWMATIKGFIKHFFQCAECASHFLRMAADGDALHVATKRDAILWAWRAHNKVNARLASEEAAADMGDAKDEAFPHVQWPPVHLCPKCRVQAGIQPPNADVVWDEQAAYDFLLQYYGTSSAAPAGFTAAASGKQRSAPASQPTARGNWASAGLLCLGVFAAVFASLRTTAQYAPVRRTYSRML